MADEEFQILVSTSDFLQLQSKCQDLQILTKKLNEQKGRLDNQLFELTQKNMQMQKKITKLEDNIVYLSKQGFKMAHKLIDKDLTESKLQESIKIQVQNQKRILLQTVKQLDQKLLDLSLAKQIIQGQNKQLIQTNRQLSATVEMMKSQIEHLNSRYIEENKKVSKLQNELKQILEGNQKITSANQKALSYLKERQEQISGYEDRIKGQNLQIKQLNTEIKKLKSEKENNEKNKSGKKEVALKEIKSLIEDYFTMYMLGLIESGGISKEQINQILQSEQEVIIRFIKDSIKNIIEQKQKSCMK